MPGRHEYLFHPKRSAMNSGLVDAERNTQLDEKWFMQLRCSYTTMAYTTDGLTTNRIDDLWYVL